MSYLSKNPNFDKPFDVMISYRSEQYSALGEALHNHLETQYHLSVFLDANSHVEGSKFAEHWPTALRREVDETFAPGYGPTVVVLATPPGAKEERILAGSTERDWVAEEILLAMRPEGGVTTIPIVVLPFGSSGIEFLRKCLQSRAPKGYDLEQFHLRREPYDPHLAEDPGAITEVQWRRICAPILQNVRAVLRRRLDDQRTKSRDWATRILAQRLSGNEVDKAIQGQRDRSEASDAIAKIAETNDALGAVIITGPGGVGKTALVAQCLLDMTNKFPNSFFPIVLTSFVQKTIYADLREKLGLRWVDPDAPFSLNDAGFDNFSGQICFVTDGLEQADDPAETARALENLRGQGKLIATTRPEVWADSRRMLSVSDDDIYKLGDLDEGSVAEVLKLGTKLQRLQFLRRIVFTDIAFYVRNGRSNWQSQSDLLRVFTELAVDTSDGEQNRDEIKRERYQLLADLATAQLHEGRFAIDEKRLISADERRREHVNWLSSTGKIAVSDGVRIRLRHDVVDSYNIARLVRGDEGGVLLQSALDLLTRGFGQIIGEGIVQTAVDSAEGSASLCEATLDSYFDEFLRLVENKRFADLQIAGWNCQYVLIAKLEYFWTRIDKVLSGNFVVRDANHAKGRAITTLRSGEITQEALSSVASLLSACRPGTVDDSDGTLFDHLIAQLSRARWRGRLIEALPRFRNHVRAYQTFKSIASEPNFIRKDITLARYFARAAVEFCELDITRIQEVLELLGELYTVIKSEEKQSSILLLRSIYNARVEVNRLINKTMVDENYTVEEIELGLSNVDLENNTQYSDWKDVESYLSVARREQGKKNEADRARIILSIGRTLWHEMTRCHASAVRELAIIDHPFARGLLLHLLTFEQFEVTETQLIRALELQAQRLQGNLEAYARFSEAFLRSCAARYELVGAERTTDLANLAAGFLVNKDVIATSGYVGRLLPPDAHVILVDQAPIAIPEWLSNSEREAEVGAELEEKLSFAGLSPDGFRILADRSSWAIPRRVHKALLERRCFFRHIAPLYPGTETMRPTDAEVGSKPRWQYTYAEEFAAHLEGAVRAYAAFEGGSSTRLPGIASLHVIALTRDGYALEAKRTSRATYCPGVWACSFEEQFKGDDEAGDDLVMACLQRGLEEEFGLKIPLHRENLRGFCLGTEWDIQNTALLVMVEIPITREEFLSRTRDAFTDEEIEEKRLTKTEHLFASLVCDPVGFWRASRESNSHPTNVARLVMANRNTRYANG